MSIGAGIYTSIAARAIFKIEHQQALCFHQSLGKELVDRNALYHFEPLLVGETPLFGNHFKAAPHIRKLFDHVAEIVARNPDDFDVVERRAICRAHTAAEQTDFTEIISARKVRKHEFAARIVFRNFYKAYAHEIKTIGWFALPRDDLPRCEPLQF